MSAACVCPDIEPVETIPSMPLTCGCCGHPLRITCEGECGEEHVRAAFKRDLRGWSPSLLQVAEHSTVVRVAPRPRGNWTCGRCAGTIPTKRGRSPLYCEACLTPAERREREQKNAANERVRMDRAVAPPAKKSKDES